MAIFARFQALHQILHRGLYEREEVLKLSLLLGLAGESLFLLGKPGLAKSLLARRLKNIFKQGRAFEYLMSRFSTPDELFGPISISKLKNQDSYERLTQGYLPQAEVVFLDEIWKAGPAIQNTLLTVLNEKIFRNGSQEEQLPLRLLLAASNELPAEEQGLEALYDRFLLRYILEPIKSEDNFQNFLQQNPHWNQTGLEQEQISPQEWQTWQNAIENISFSAPALAALNDLRQRFLLANNPLDKETQAPYISDRRWFKLAQLLKACAFLHERTEVLLQDLVILEHGLWDSPQQRDWLHQELKTCLNQARRKRSQALHQSLLSSVQALELKIKRSLYTERLVKAEAPELISGTYYEVLGNFDVYHWLIHQEVYERLSDKHYSDVYLIAKHNYGQRLAARARRLGRHAIELQIRAQFGTQLTEHSCMLRTTVAEQWQRVLRILSPEEKADLNLEAEALQERLKAALGDLTRTESDFQREIQGHWFGRSDWWESSQSPDKEAERGLSNLDLELQRLIYELKQA